MGAPFRSVASVPPQKRERQSFTIQTDDGLLQCVVLNCVSFLGCQQDTRGVSA